MTTECQTEGCLLNSDSVCVNCGISEANQQLVTEYLEIANTQETGRKLIKFEHVSSSLVDQLKSDKSVMRRQMRSQQTEIEALRLALRAAGLDY